MKKIIIIAMFIILFILSFKDGIDMHILFYCSILFGVLYSIFYKSKNTSKEISKPCINELKEMAQLIIHDDDMRNKKLSILEILSQTSKEFLCSMSPNGGKVEKLLKGVVETLEVDRGYMFKLNNKIFDLTYAYDINSKNKMLNVPFSNINVDDHNSLYNKLYMNKTIDTANDLSRSEMALFKRAGVKSLILIPIHVDGIFTGFMGFDTKKFKIWDEIEIDSINIVSEIFAAWSSRRHAHELLEKENMELKK